MSDEKKDNSGELFDKIMAEFSIKNDRALAVYLNVAPPTISKIRSGSQPVTPATILVVHEKTGWPVSYIRQLLAAADGA